MSSRRKDRTGFDLGNSDNRGFRELQSKLEKATEAIAKLQEEKIIIAEKLQKVEKKLQRAEKNLEKKDQILTNRARLQGSLDDLLRREEREKRMTEESSRPSQTFVFNLFGPDSPLRTSPRDLHSPEKRSRSDEEDRKEYREEGTKRRLLF